jgi:hypothetical protein
VRNNAGTGSALPTICVTTLRNARRLDVEVDQDAGVVAEPDAVDRLVADQLGGHDPCPRARVRVCGSDEHVVDAPCSSRVRRSTSPRIVRSSGLERGWRFPGPVTVASDIAVPSWPH